METPLFHQKWLPGAQVMATMAKMKPTHADDMAETLAAMRASVAKAGKAASKVAETQERIVAQVHRPLPPPSRY